MGNQHTVAANIVVIEGVAANIVVIEGAAELRAVCVLDPAASL